MKRQPSSSLMTTKLGIKRDGSGKIAKQDIKNSLTPRDEPYMLDKEADLREFNLMQEMTTPPNQNL